MAQGIGIYQLPEADTLSGDEAIPIDTGSDTKRVTVAKVRAGLLPEDGDGAAVTVDGRALGDWTPRIDRPAANLCPNSSWFVMTGFDPVVMPDAGGAGTMPTIAVSGYTTGSNEVTVSTANTQGLVDGMLVRFAAPADTALRYCTQSNGVTINTFSLRAYDVTATTFKVRPPLGRAPSVSAACTVTMVTPGDTTGVSGDGPDGWGKSTTLKLWRDVHSTHRRAGSRYQLGLRKGSASAELLACTVPAQSLDLYRGRQMAFGAAVKQAVRGGAGTWRVAISDGATITYSDPAPAAAGYQWLSVSATIPAGAASVTVWLETGGASGDVYYVAKPMVAFGPAMDEAAYYPSAGRIFFDRKFTPLSFNTIDYTTPSVADGLGLYSTRVDVYQDTNGAICPEVRWLDAQFEAIGGTGSCGTALAVRSNESTGVKFGVAPIYCAVEGIMCASAGSIQLDPSGCFWVFGNLPGIPRSFVSIDINGAGV